MSKRRPVGPRGGSLIFACVALLLVTGSASAPGAEAGGIRAIRLPHAASVGVPWRATLAVVPRAPAPVVIATGPRRLSARGVRVGPDRFNVTLRFPRIGTWTLTARSGRNRARLGQVVVDLRPTALLADVFALAAEPSGTLLVGQVHDGGIVRASLDGRATRVTPDVSVFHLSVGPSGTIYVTLHENGGLFRVGAGGQLESLVPGGRAVVAVEGSEGVYALSGNTVVRLDGDGAARTVASGLSSPLGLTVGPDGDLYVADTGNGVIRRIDRVTYAVRTVAADLGYVVSVAIARDGTIWSSSVAEGGRPGVWRTSPVDGTSTRLVPHEVSAVTIGSDGAVYACAFRERRILRIDPVSGAATAVLRSGP
jgi:hypothetical protein